MSSILDKVINAFKQKSKIDIEQVVSTRVEQAIDEIRLHNTAGHNIYASLEASMINDLKEKQSEIRQLGVDLEKAQQFISGSFNGYLSGHTGSDVLASWNKHVANIDDEIAPVLMSIKAKARDLYRNDATMHRYVKGQMNNIVGEGFTYEASIRNSRNEKDVKTSAWLEQRFAKFLKRGNVDVSGRLSIEDIQRMHFIDLPQDGEFLVRKIFDKNINSDGFALQILDSTRLDYTVNKGFSNGNAVVMGVECNKYGKPVAYYIKTDFENSTKTERIPASEIYHGFIQEYPEQRRAVPWMHAAMMDAKQLAAFSESVLWAARFGANTTATIETQPGNEVGFSTGRLANGQLYRNLDQGEILTLNPGEKLQYHTPPFPNNSIEPFVKVLNRRLAQATVSSYSSLTSDYSDSNFSSSRLGVNEERQDWKTKQAWYIDSFLMPLFQDWLLHCLTHGKLVNGSKKYTLDDYSLLNNMTFKGKTWPYIDPVKDIKADLMEYELGTTTLRDLAARQGKDIDDILAERAQEYKKVKELSIPLKAYVDLEQILAQTSNLKEPKETLHKDTSKEVDSTKKDEPKRSLTDTPIIIQNIHKAPGLRTIKTPVLDENGITVKVIEEYEEIKDINNITEGTE